MHRLDQPDLATGLDDGFDSSHLNNKSNTAAVIRKEE
jgi:hypothetical protein